MFKIFKDPKIKKIALILLVVIIILVLFWLIFKKKKAVIQTESSFEENNDNKNTLQVESQSTQNQPEENNNDLPSFYNLEYRIATSGKKSVFPFIIEKITEGPIELPNRRSLLNKDAKYKFIDVMPGDKIKVVSIQNLSYTLDHNVFNDNFLITDKDYLISYTQAKEHFKINENE
jgi:cbb3-type cytochrome oxidase subunit 3